MRNKTIYITIACVLMMGCERETPNNNKQEEEIHNISYGVRALGENRPAAPAEGTAYTFVSYPHKKDNSDVTDVANYLYEPPVLPHPWGYYSYMSDSKYKGILQPCRILSSAERWNSLVRVPENGQGLVNNHYMSVCFHPAVTPRNDGRNSTRILFTRKDKRLASNPFHIYVQGYEVFDLPEPYDDGNTVPIKDIRSKVWVDIIQGGSQGFTISDLMIVNAGYWGWYHPLMQRTAVSYFKGNEFNNGDEFHLVTTDDAAIKEGRYNIYDKDLNPTAGNQEALSIVPGVAPIDGTGIGETIYGPGPDGKDNIIYSTGRGENQGIFLFSNDYTTDVLLQPGLSFKLVMGTESFDVVVPLKINMKANHAYLFRLTVKSSVIMVHVQSADWIKGNKDKEDQDVGDDSDWLHLGTWNVKGWEDGNPGQSTLPIG